MGHMDGWMATFAEGLRKHDGDELAAAIECGRWCAALGSVQDARAACASLGPEASLSDVVTALNERRIAGGNLRVLDDRIVGTYATCPCPTRERLVTRYPFFCNCTRGWTAAVFEEVLGHPVDVELVRAIGMGDDHCEFVVWSSAPSN